MSVRVRWEGKGCMRSRRHERTPTRLGPLGAANKIEVVAAPAGKVFSFNSHDGIDIGEVIDTKQPDLAVMNFATGFGRNNHGPGPAWKAKGTVRTLPEKRAVVGLRTEFAHPVLGNDATDGKSKQATNERVEFGFWHGSGTALVTAGLERPGAKRQRESQAFGVQGLDEVNKVEGGAEKAHRFVCRFAGLE